MSMGKPKLVFRDLVAIVTGASSGIGQATTLALAERGARLALGARNLPALEVLVRQIKAAGGEALAVATDVTRREQVEVILPSQTRLLYYLNVVSPNLADWATRFYHLEGRELREG